MGSGSPCWTVLDNGPDQTWSIGMTFKGSSGAGTPMIGGAAAWHSQHRDASELSRVPQEMHFIRIPSLYQGSTKSASKLERRDKFPRLRVRIPTGSRVRASG